jgi:hypothetical protein
MYFIIPNKEWYKIAFSDLGENQKSVKTSKKESAITLLLNMTDRSKIFSNIYIRKLLYNLYPFGKLIDKNEIVYLCFTDNTYRQINKEYLKWLKNEYLNVKVILLLYNKISLLYNRPGNEQLYELPNNGKDLYADYIFTYDPNDAKTLGLKYFEIYSKYDKLVNVNLFKNKDIFYCGSVTYRWKMSRLELVEAIYEYLRGYGVICDFHMTFENDASDLECEFKEKQKMQYLEILKHDLSSNVILEIVSDGKFGPTFRYFEAVVYNKKLLTNNPDIVDLPFYNSQYMRIFSNVEDIDAEWIKREEDVEYQYNGEFSPQELWRQIQEYDC